MVKDLRSFNIKISFLPRFKPLHPPLSKLRPIKLKNREATKTTHLTSISKTILDTTSYTMIASFVSKEFGTMTEPITNFHPATGGLKKELTKDLNCRSSTKKRSTSTK